MRTSGLVIRRGKMYVLRQRGIRLGGPPSFNLATRLPEPRCLSSYVGSPGGFALSKTLSHARARSFSIGAPP